jgi:hypothetical protein
VAARLLHAPPPLAVRGFTRRCKKTRGSGKTFFHLPFLAGGDLQNTKKHNKAVDFNFIFSFSNLILSPSQIYPISIFSLLIGSFNFCWWQILRLDLVVAVVVDGYANA